MLHTTTTLVCAVDSLDRLTGPTCEGQMRSTPFGFRYLEVLVAGPLERSYLPCPSGCGGAAAANRPPALGIAEASSTGCPAAA